MGQVLHGSARTTAAVRRAKQDSQESLRVLGTRKLSVALQKGRQHRGYEVGNGLLLPIRFAIDLCVAREIAMQLRANKDRQLDRRTVYARASG